MKKKQIEQIPYITIAKTVRKKNVKYIAATAWKNIGHERHIILEVYRNEKESLQVPVVRYAATRKDWGVFFPETGVWRKQRITEYAGYRGFCWNQPSDGRTITDLEEGNVLHAPDDLNRVRNFFTGIKVWNEKHWWDFFVQNESSIREEERSRRQRLREERLQERIKHTPRLKEQELLEWASKQYSMAGHYLYYKKKGRRADICCSACGNVSSGKWKPGESFESQLCGKMIIEPREGHIGYCPTCGVHGTYKPQGKVRGRHEIKSHVFTVDKYHSDGVVLRYVDLYKVYTLETALGENEEEMLTAHENMQGIEIARTYFVPGKKPQTDYCKYNHYTGRDFWDDCNLYDMNNIKVEKAMIHPDAWANLKGTFLQYSAMEEYAREKKLVNAKDYLERYMEWPQIEMLVKMKLFGIVDSMVSCRCGIIEDQTAARPDLFLGIRKDKVKLLTGCRGRLEILEILQIEKRMQQNWTDGQIRALAEIGAKGDQLERALAVMTVQKMLNNISGYAGCGYGTGCSGAYERLRHIATTYFDYLDMRAQRGYDLTNTVYQKPRNLSDAHHAMVMEIDDTKQDERLKDVAQRYPEIRKQYRKLRKQYYYEDDQYLIRPARTAEEIVMEGRTLHHCVGGDNYLRKHNTGESTILMLRFRSEPDIPYITVEIREEHIIQWYGAHDKKPDKNNMQRWLDRYTIMLGFRRLGTTPPAEQETVQLPAYA